MSLVYEALQKAEREKQRHSGSPARSPDPAPPLPTPAAVPVAVAGPRAQNYRAIVIVCGALIGMAVGMYFFVTGLCTWAEHRTASTSAPPPAGNPSSPNAAASAVAAAPAPPATTPAPTANDPRFQLTGIMKMGDEYAAVINGRIVQVDHYVNGAIVKSISRDRVILMADGRELVVRLY